MSWKAMGTSFRARSGEGNSLVLLAALGDQHADQQGRGGQGGAAAADGRARRQDPRLDRRRRRPGMTTPKIARPHRWLLLIPLNTRFVFLKPETTMQKSRS